MAIRVCPLCQAEFLEIRELCTHCNVALIDLDDDTDPRALSPDEQVVYDLAQWPLDAVSDAAQVLAESGIPHVWDGSEVILPLIHEAAADRLFEEVEERFGLDSADEDVTSPNGEVPQGETEYDMAAWPAHRRMELVSRLVELGVPHRWEGDLLVVATSLESAVDGLLDDIDDVDEDDDADEDEDDDEAEMVDPAEVLSGLFLAAERLRRKRADVDTYGGLLACLEVSSEAHPPYGVDGRVWGKALEVGERLADAVADDAEDTEQIADELHTLLRPYV